MTSTRDVSRYYDFIYYWTQITNRFRAFREIAPHTIHRALVDPLSGEPRTETIHQLIADAARPLGVIDALDAGCGYGGVAIELHRLLGGRFHGVTINRHQIRIAANVVKQMGLDSAISFRHASYDEPPGRTFNLIYAIESLAHSPEPARSIASLAHALAPGGLLMVIDDMPVEPFPAHYQADLEGFKAGWHCPVLPTAAHWKRLMSENGLAIQSDRDLTPLIRPRPEAEIAAGLAEIAARRRWRDRLGLRLVADAQAGGLYLERLNSARAVEYHMIVAQRA